MFFWSPSRWALGYNALSLRHTKPSVRQPELIATKGSHQLLCKFNKTSSRKRLPELATNLWFREQQKQIGRTTSVEVAHPSIA